MEVTHNNLEPPLTTTDGDQDKRRSTQAEDKYTETETEVSEGDRSNTANFSKFSQADDLDTDSYETGRVDLADDMDTPMRPMKNTLVLAFSFLSVYTAFQGIQNIQSSINQKEGLGVASLSCIYATLILAAVLSPVYIHTVGLKNTFVIAFLSHCLYTLSNFYPEWWTLIPSSIFLGLAVAPMWIGRHLYINAMGQYNSQANNVDLHGSLSKHNGIFFSLFCFAQVAGNFISSVILHQSSTDQSDLNQTLVCGADDCPGKANHTTIIVRPETGVIDTLLGVYLACGVLGVLVTAIFLRPLRLEKNDKDSLFRKSIVCFTVFRDKKFLLLIPLSLSQAVNTSILLTSFTKAFVSCSVGVKMVGYVMMAYGMVSALSAVTFGYVAKYSGRRPLVAFTLVVDIVTLVLLLRWKPVPEQAYLLFIIPCIWAFGDGLWSTQILSLVAMTFPNKQPAVFSNIGTWGSIGFTLVLVTDRLVCLRVKFYFAIALWALGTVCYIVLEIVTNRTRGGVTAYYKPLAEDSESDEVEFQQKSSENKGD